MNILYLCGSYGLDLDKMLGPKRHVQAILNGLAKLGHTPILLAIQNKTKLNDYDEYKHYILKHKAVRFFIHRLIPYTGIYNSIRIFIKIIKLHKEYNFDVIHERYTRFSWSGIIAAKFLKIPHILEMNGPGIIEKKIQKKSINNSSKWISNIHLKYVTQNSNNIILASGAIENYLKQQTGYQLPKNTIFLNGANIPTLPSKIIVKKLKQKYSINKNTTTILYAGSLYKWYGSLEMIKAFCIVSQKYPEIKFIIIGSGDNIEQLKEYIENNNSSANIHFYSPVESEELIQIIQIVDICSVYYKDPITYFGTSTKVTEYLATGSIVVATPHMYEIIKHGFNGYLSKSSKIQDYTDMIIYALEHQHEWEEMSENAQQNIRENYTWEIYCKKLEKIYTQ